MVYAPTLGIGTTNSQCAWICALVVKTCLLKFAVAVAHALGLTVWPRANQTRVGACAFGLLIVIYCTGSMLTTRAWLTRYYMSTDVTFSSCNQMGKKKLEFRSM